MKIRKITIQHYKGVKKLEWALPDRSFFCLLGPGDASKTSILEAISLVFYPGWEPPIKDTDFYQGARDNPIVIELVVGDLIDDFFSDNRYGLNLIGWDKKHKKAHEALNDPLEPALRIRFSMEGDEAPKWEIYKSGNAVRNFSVSDRKKIYISALGDGKENAFSWAEGALMDRLTHQTNLKEFLADAGRSMRDAIDETKKTLVACSAAAQEAESIAKKIGAAVIDSYQMSLDMGLFSIKPNQLTLHDGLVPLRNLGVGSRRLILCGLQKKFITRNHITIFDDMEAGLEPHRIIKLIREIKTDDGGQYFSTTHSPTVIRELSAADLYIVHKNDDIVQIMDVSQPDFGSLNIEKKIKSSADAFLAKKILVCEGETEVGFLKGYDSFMGGDSEDSFALHGVCLLNAVGNTQITKIAKSFFDLGYDIAVFGDGDDNRFTLEKARAEVSDHTPVFIWGSGFSTEQAVFRDLPWPYVQQSVLVAFAKYPKRKDWFMQFKNLVQDPLKWVETADLRKTISDKAKSEGWFKDIKDAETWFFSIQEAFDDSSFSKTEVFETLNKIWIWAKK